MFRSAFSLLTIAALPIFAVNPAQGLELLAEPETGHEYPAKVQSTLRTVDSKAKSAPRPEELTLLGLSVKETSILSRDVYSCALYAETSFTYEELVPLAGPNAKALGQEGDLQKKLLMLNSVKELRIRYCRDVDVEDFVGESLDDFERRIALAAAARILTTGRVIGTANDTTNREDLASLTELFPSDGFEEGHELRFTWHPDGTLCTVVNNKRKPDLKSPDLAQALFDAFLGEEPISGASKKSLVARIPDLLVDTVQVRLAALTIPEGSSWRKKADDLRGEPDLFVQLFEDGRKVASSTVESGWKVDFTRDEENFWTIRADAAYRLKVYDSDLLLNDLVGEIIGLKVDDFTREGGRILEDPDSLNPRACSVVHVEVVAK